MIAVSALASALKQIEAQAQERAAFEQRLALDARYQFLLRTAKANDIEFGDRDYGHAGMGRLIEYHQTGAPYRRQRAKALVELRQAFLFNRYRGMGKRVHEITRYRRAEKLDRSLSTMAREHSEGRVGATPVRAEAPVSQLHQNNEAAA